MSGVTQTLIIDPLPSVGIIVGILIERALKGGWFLNHGSTLVAFSLLACPELGFFVSRLYLGYCPDSLTVG